MTTLASGSLGNCTLLEAGETRVLIDAGLAADELEARLAGTGTRPSDVSAVILTHRHKDHTSGATDFCKRHRIPVHATRRTLRSLGTEVHRRAKRFDVGHSFAVAGLTVHSVPVAHDAPETVALVVDAQGVRYGHVTDLGRVDETLREALAGCHALYLEFNHELEMLWDGADPPHLKQRIAGPLGHLSNAAAAGLLADVAHRGLQTVWLAHLSARNNTPEVAMGHAKRALGGCGAEVVVALQDAGTSATIVRG